MWSQLGLRCDRRGYTDLGCKRCSLEAHRRTLNRNPSNPRQSLPTQEFQPHKHLTMQTARPKVSKHHCFRISFWACPWPQGRSLGPLRHRQRAQGTSLGPLGLWRSPKGQRSSLGPLAIAKGPREAPRAQGDPLGTLKRKHMTYVRTYVCTKRAQTQPLEVTSRFEV